MPKLTKRALLAAVRRDLLEMQGGKCFICGKFPDSNDLLNVDHDHATGEIRGLLCRRCNMGLGMFQDSIQRFERCIEYLSKESYGTDYDWLVNNHSEFFEGDLNLIVKEIFGEDYLKSE